MNSIHLELVRQDILLFVISMLKLVLCASLLYTICIYVYMKTEMWLVYRLFDYEDDFKWKNFEIQSYRSRRKLQFSYKVYLHPSSKNRLDPYCRSPRR
jgi:hypothetical protein